MKDLCDPQSVTFRHGWIKPTDRSAYWRAKGNGRDKKYTAEMSGTKISKAEVLLHGFALTAGGRLPAAVRRAIMDAKKRWDDKE